MPRGQRAEPGDESIAQNGYTWVKLTHGSKYKHVLIAEAKLGRLLEDDEYVVFRDKDRTNFDPDNILVDTFVKKVPSLTSLNKVRTRLDKVEEKFKEEVQQIRTALDELEAAILSENE